MIAKHLAIHFGLLVLSVGGFIECVRVLRINLLDITSLPHGTNGPKRLSIRGRVFQSAFLLAAFAVLSGVGMRIALASEAELEPPLVLTLIVSLDAIAMVLMVKEVTMRQTRVKLDAYYDEMQAHAEASVPQ